MEKRVAHYALALVRKLLKDGAFMVTASATKDAFSDFGLSDAVQILPYVESLTPSDLYKSMTAHHDNTLWHDVYKKQIMIDEPPRPIRAYIKLQIVQKRLVIISFKREDQL